MGIFGIKRKDSQSASIQPPQIDFTQAASKSHVQQKRNVGLNDVDKERLLRLKRPQKVIDFIKKMDAHTDKDCVSKLKELMDVEFQEIYMPEEMLGIVSRCYLGAPYDVHIIDMMGNIVQHFENYTPMPDRFQAARSLALSGMYEYIEVYPSCLRAISSDGSVSEVKC